MAALTKAKYQSIFSYTGKYNHQIATIGIRPPSNPLSHGLSHMRATDIISVLCITSCSFIHIQQECKTLLLYFLVSFLAPLTNDFYPFPCLSQT
jgi:hypothetical protein